MFRRRAGPGHLSSRRLRLGVSTCVHLGVAVAVRIVSQPELNKIINFAAAAAAATAASAHRDYTFIGGAGIDIFECDLRALSVNL